MYKENISSKRIQGGVPANHPVSTKSGLSNRKSKRVANFKRKKDSYMDKEIRKQNKFIYSKKSEAKDELEEITTDKILSTSNVNVDLESDIGSMLPVIEQNTEVRNTKTEKKLNDDFVYTIRVVNLFNHSIYRDNKAYISDNNIYRISPNNCSSSIDIDQLLWIIELIKYLYRNSILVKDYPVVELMKEIKGFRIVKFKDLQILPYGKKGYLFYESCSTLFVDGRYTEKPTRFYREVLSTITGYIHIGSDVVEHTCQFNLELCNAITNFLLQRDRSKMMEYESVAFSMSRIYPTISMNDITIHVYESLRTLNNFRWSINEIRNSDGIYHTLISDCTEREYLLDSKMFFQSILLVFLSMFSLLGVPFTV